jgi:hypothetical protein
MKAVAKTGIFTDVPRIVAEHYGIEEPTFEDFTVGVYPHIIAAMFGPPTTVDNSDGTFTHTWSVKGNDGDHSLDAVPFDADESTEPGSGHNRRR